MKEDMPNIDTSGIDQLREIKAEQDVVHERLDKMESMKGKVSEAVFAKVHREYTEKMDELVAQADPLKHKIRGQYAILHGIMDDLQQKLDALNLEKEELEFRNTLGEFEPGDFDAKMDEWNVGSMEIKAEMEEADNMKQLFLSVFDSEDDLQADAPPEPISEAPPEPELDLEPEPELEPEPQPEAEPDLESAADTLDQLDQADDLIDAEDLGPELDDLDALDDAGTAPTEDIQPVDDDFEDIKPEPAETPVDEDEEVTGEFEPLNEEALDAALEGEDLETSLDDDIADLETDLDEDTDIALPPLPSQDDPLKTQPVTTPPNTDELTSVPPLPEERTVFAGDLGANLDGDDDVQGTMIVSNPKVIALNNAIEGQVFTLGMGSTSIGRSPENDLHLTEDRISRKHAQIAFGPGGYSIYDLNSENGTYVNGNRIREHFLSDGDIIMIGTYKFLFRDR